MGEVQKIEQTAPALSGIQPITPMEMISQAVANGGGVEMVEKLMALEERWQANQGRREFDQAISAAKAQIPPIKRNKEGHNSKKYADFSAIARVVDPILAEHGLSYRFRTSQEDAIKVTCVLSHSSGHSEESTLCGPADGSGGKSAIHAIGSTLTYLQRYSLIQALGLAVADDDDAAASSAGDQITEEQATSLRELIEKVGADAEAFCKYWKIGSVPELPAGKYQQAKTTLEQFGARKHG